MTLRSDIAAANVRQYMVITGNYWAFTVTDGALRMLILLYFYQLGYSPLDLSLLFLLYECFGVVTNLVGGWLGARLGLNRTMNAGLLLQIIALLMLLVPAEYLVVVWVMAAQALSGIAKDLNKMSAKSAIKLLLPPDDGSRLFKWVAFLTGSKNALKGAGYFLGGLLLHQLGFQGAVLSMTLVLIAVWLCSVYSLRQDLGRSEAKPKFNTIFSKSSDINYLSASRLFLFGSRDVWFVVALPVFLASQLGWSQTMIGGFLASWIIGYGVVQALAPKIVFDEQRRPANGTHAFFWALILAVIPFSMAVALKQDWPTTTWILGGLLVFGVVFAINSSLHSFLIVKFASAESVSLDVGFYYMANAMGRLIGTLLSGLVFQTAGLTACLLVSAGFVILAAIFARQSGGSFTQLYESSTREISKLVSWL